MVPPDCRSQPGGAPRRGGRDRRSHPRAASSCWAASRRACPSGKRGIFVEGVASGTTVSVRFDRVVVLPLRLHWVPSLLASASAGGSRQRAAPRGALGWARWLLAGRHISRGRSLPRGGRRQALGRGAPAPPRRTRRRDRGGAALDRRPLGHKVGVGSKVGKTVKRPAPPAAVASSGWSRWAALSSALRQRAGVLVGARVLARTPRILTLEDARLASNTNKTGEQQQ